MIVLGIDPGKSGGLAWRGMPEVSALAVSMPETISDLLMEVKRLKVDFAVLEKVHSMPTDGRSSIFKFGRGVGHLEMALTAAGIPYEEVTPQKWMRALGITPRAKSETKTQFKNRLKQKAQQLFPAMPVTLKTADALLIAHYAWRTRK